MEDNIPDTGYEMFTKRNGEPILFSIPICPEKEQLRKLIETYGGTVTSVVGGHHTIRLIPPNLKVPVAKGYDIFSTRFIEDSVSSKRILDLNCYRIGRSQFTNKINVNDILLGSKSWIDCENVGEDSGEEVSDFDEDCGPSVQWKKGFKPNRRDYSYNEKKAILQFIIKNRRYSEVKGRALWQEMEAKKVCEGRTWGSMKEHFRRAIMNNLHLFKLTDDEKKKLSSPYAVYVETSEISFLRSDESLSESDTDIDMPRKQRGQMNESIKEDRKKFMKKPQKSAELAESDLSFDDLLEKEACTMQKFSDNKNGTGQEQKTVANESSSKIPGDEIDKELDEKECCEVTHETVAPVINTGTDSAELSKVNGTKLAGPSKIIDPEAEESSDESNDCLALEQPDTVAACLRLPDIVCSAPLPPLQNTESFDPVLTSQEFPSKRIEFLLFNKKKVSATSSSKHCRSPTHSKESVNEELISEQSPAQTRNKPDMDVSETNSAKDIDSMHSQMFANITLPESSGNLPSSHNISEETSGKSRDPSHDEIIASVEGEPEKNVAPLSTNQLVHGLVQEWNADSDSSSSSRSGSSTIIFELTRSDDKGEQCPDRLSKNKGHKSCHHCDGEETCVKDTDECAVISLPKGGNEGKNHRKDKKQLKSNNGKPVCGKILNKALQVRQEGNGRNSDSSSSGSGDVLYEDDSDEEPIKLRRDTHVSFASQLRFKPELQKDVSKDTKEQDDNRTKRQCQENCTNKVIKCIDNSSAVSSELESEPESVVLKYRSDLNASDPIWNRDNFTGRYDRAYNPHGGRDVSAKGKPHNGYKRKQNLPYSKDEDIAILEYIIEKRAYGRLGGREFWQEMERNLLPKRTWQSLKERFRMRIASRLPSYVEHGISEGRLRRLGRAINLPNEESKVKEEEKEEESEVHRKQYSRGEDQAIIHFIIKNKRHAEVGGKMMWVLMSKKVPLLRRRTWLSLKERFRRRIINHLEDFDISLDDKKRMLMNENQGRKAHQKRYFSSRYREESSSESSDSDFEEERDQPSGKIPAKKFSERCLRKCRDASHSDTERNKRSRQIMEKHFSDHSQASSNRCVAPRPSETRPPGKADKINTELPQNKRKRKLYSQDEGVVLTLPHSEDIEIGKYSEDSLPEKHVKENLESVRHSDQDARHGECSSDLRSSLINQNCEAFICIEGSEVLNNDKEESGHVPDDTKMDILAGVVLVNSDSIHTNSQNTETEQNITPNSPPPADVGSIKQESPCKYSLKHFLQEEATPPVTRCTSKSTDSSRVGRDSRKTRSSRGVTPRRKLRKKAVRCCRC